MTGDTNCNCNSGWAGGDMTLRDWFAGQAIGTVLLGSASTDHEFIKDLGNGTRGGRFAATAAYAIADAMLAERSKP